MNINEIFKLPNTDDNLFIRSQIINRYKKLNNIPQSRGINIFEVKKWANENFKELKEINEESYYCLIEQDSCPICQTYVYDDEGSFIDCNCGAIYSLEGKHYLLGSSNKESEDTLNELLNKE